VDKARVYLPRSFDGSDYGYVNLNAPHEYLASGQWVTVASPWRESIPLLAKIGGAIPVGKDVQTRMPGDKSPESKALPEDDHRGVEIFPPKGSSHGHTFSTTWYEDDGLSLKPNISSFMVSYVSTEEKVTVAVAPHSDNIFVPSWKDVVLLLPHGDERYIESSRGFSVERLSRDSNGRVRYRMPLTNSRDRLAKL
jgi:alpha-glucosidase (family GH31 glycosyl hydrolase)